MKKITPSLVIFGLCAMTAGAAPQDGYVVRVDSQTVYLDWGTSSTAKPGDRFKVVRPGETLKHPVSGEILGRTDDVLAEGILQSIEEKYSVGRLETVKSAVRSGDRSRWTSAAGVTPSVTPTASAQPSTVPQELWRSPALNNENAVALTFIDLDRDGQKEVAIAFKNEIRLFRFKNNVFEPMHTWSAKRYGRLLTLDAADVKGDGQDMLFATSFPSGSDRPKALVLHYENNELKKIDEFEGFVRSYVRADGKKVLLRQTTGPSVELSYSGVSEVDFTPKGYIPGKPLDLNLSKDQALGFAWGSWTGAGQHNFAVLDRGEWLRITHGEAKWKSNDTYGGTRNDFPYGRNSLGSVSPRLLSWRPAFSDKDLLVVSKNFPELGIRFTYLKIFRRSEITALSWNGQDMAPVWKLPIDGYLADFAIENALPDAPSQLWALVVGAGKKTVLVRYRLP